MLRRVPLFVLALSACGFRPSERSHSSVTVTLPPPKEAAAPGFSSNLRDSSPAIRDEGPAAG